MLKGVVQNHLLDGVLQDLRDQAGALQHAKRKKNRLATIRCPFLRVIYLNEEIGAGVGCTQSDDITV